MTTRKTLTRWCDPEEEFENQYGETTYREWCEEEVARFRRAEKRVAVVENGKGKIALRRM